MTDQSDSHRGTRLLVIMATCVIIIWGINQAQSVDITQKGYIMTTRYALLSAALTIALTSPR
jgi:hypothetical protein